MLCRLQKRVGAKESVKKLERRKAKTDYHVEKNKLQDAFLLT